ncbi:MAG TPA: hypothetical protein VGK58_04080 [Lacipirellulaceae bacterium]
MAKILLAVSRELCAVLERVLAGHKLVCPETIARAEELLCADQFDLIVCTVLFDESRMFDLLRMAKSRHEWQQIPFVCVRVRHDVLSDRIAREAVAFTCHALGAAAFLNSPDYKDDLELRQAIERHLPAHLVA